MSKFVSTASRVELVITAPESLATGLAYNTRSRTTLGVLTQLLAQARSHVIIAAPFMQPGHGLSSGALAAALEAALHRNVRVDVLSTRPSLQTLDREVLLRSTRGTIRFFRPQQNILDEQKLGSHAKFCIADGESAYVGSANLTGPGFGDQIEMGLLVHGEIALQIERFWMHAIEIGLFVETE